MKYVTPFGVTFFFNNKEDFLFSFIERMSLRFIGSRLEHVSLVHV